MLTVLLSTARAANCFTHHPEWNQFELLARCLGQQSYRDFELVVVTPFAEEAKQHLGFATVVQPRSTPWRREKMFAVASARNTGLVHAKGDWVLVIDDCTEFEGDFLDRVANYSRQGLGVAVMYKNAKGDVIDPRWSAFKMRADRAEFIMLGQRDSLTPYGYISFPIKSALAVNGYDELRFDGARGLEDMNFAKRLMASGVRMAMDQRIMVRLHDHLGYPPEIIDNEAQNARCCNTAHALSQLGAANRARYTAEEKQKILNCMYWKDGGKCGYHGKDCAYPKWAKDGHPVARRILENDEEELFDLAAARREVGL